MDLVAARNLALTLMKYHGLHKFTFEFTRSTTIAGQCVRDWRYENLPLSVRPGKIKMSRLYAEEWTEDQFKETLLHEIAHALTPMSCKPHGPEWKAKALEIGCNGKRCVEEEDFIDLAKYHKWIVYCPKGHYQTRARKGRSLRSCGKCAPKVFDMRYLMQWLPNTPENIQKVERLKDGAMRVITQSDSKPAPLPKRQVSNVQVAAKKVAAPASRADEYDKGSAFINWD